MVKARLAAGAGNSQQQKADIQNENSLLCMKPLVSK